MSAQTARSVRPSAETSDKTKATGEQLRMAQLISDSGKHEDPDDLKKKIKQITDITGCTDMDAASALHDSGNVTEAINQLMDTNKNRPQDEWQTSTKQKKQKNKAPPDTPSKDRVSSPHQQQHHYQQTVTTHGTDNTFRSPPDPQHPPLHDDDFGGNFGEINGVREDQRYGGPGRGASQDNRNGVGGDQPPRFRGRGGGVGGGSRGGFSSSRGRGGDKENGPQFDSGHRRSQDFDETRLRGGAGARGGTGQHEFRDHDGFAQDHRRSAGGEFGDRDRGGGGRGGRGGGPSAGRRGGDGDSHRGPSDRGFSSGRGGGNTWTNSSRQRGGGGRDGGRQQRDDNVWSNDMANQFAPTKQSRGGGGESNTWDNSMAEAVLTPKQQQQQQAGARGGDISTSDDWNGEDDWMHGTRVFTNQAAPAPGELKTAVSSFASQVSGGGGVDSSTTPATTGPALTFHGQNFDVNQLMSKPLSQSNQAPPPDPIPIVSSFTPAGVAPSQQQTATSWHAQATDSLKNQLGIGKVSETSRVPSHNTQQSAFRTPLNESHAAKAKSAVEMPGSSITNLDVQFGNFDLNGGGSVDSNEGFMFGTVDPIYSSSVGYVDLTMGPEKPSQQSQQQRMPSGVSSNLYQRTAVSDTTSQMNGPSSQLIGGGVVVSDPLMAKPMAQHDAVLLKQAESGLSSSFAGGYVPQSQQQQMKVGSSVVSSAQQQQQMHKQQQQQASVQQQQNSQNQQQQLHQQQQPQVSLSSIGYSTAEFIPSQTYAPAKLQSQQSFDAAMQGQLQGQNQTQQQVFYYYGDMPPQVTNATGGSNNRQTALTSVSNAKIQLPNLSAPSYAPTQLNAPQGFPAYGQPTYGTPLNAAAEPYMPGGMYAAPPMFGQGLFPQQFINPMVDMASLGQGSLIPSSLSGRENNYSTGEPKSLSRTDVSSSTSTTGVSGTASGGTGTGGSGSVTATSGRSSLTGAPPPAPGPPGLTPTVSNAQAAAMVANFASNFGGYNPYMGINPYLQAYPAPPPFVPQVTQTPNVGAFQKAGGYPGGYVNNYEMLEQDYSKQQQNAAFNSLTGQPAPGAPGKVGGLVGGDLGKNYGGVVTPYDTTKQFVQHTGTPPPYGNVATLNSLNFFPGPAGFIQNPYGMQTMLHSPQIVTHGLPVEALQVRAPALPGGQVSKGGSLLAASVPKGPPHQGGQGGYAQQMQAQYGWQTD